MIRKTLKIKDTKFQRLKIYSFMLCIGLTLTGWLEWFMENQDAESNNNADVMSQIIR